MIIFIKVPTLTRAVSLTANHESPAHKPAFILPVMEQRFFVVTKKGQGKAIL